jgi:hypothetical protein
MRGDEIPWERARLARSTPSRVATDDSAVSRNLHRRTIESFDRAAMQAISTVTPAVEA